MTNNIHYIAQQIKLIVEFMEQHILYSKDQVTVKEVKTIIRRLNLVAEATRLPKELMTRLIIRVFHYGAWWYDETLENSSESDKLLCCNNLRNLVELYWYNNIDHHDQYCLPSTSEVMELVEQEIRRYNKK